MRARIRCFGLRLRNEVATATHTAGIKRWNGNVTELIYYNTKRGLRDAVESLIAKVTD